MKVPIIDPTWPRATVVYFGLYAKGIIFGGREDVIPMILDMLSEAHPAYKWSVLRVQVQNKILMEGSSEKTGPKSVLVSFDSITVYGDLPGAPKVKRPVVIPRSPSPDTVVFVVDLGSRVFRNEVLSEIVDCWAKKVNTPYGLEDQYHLEKSDFSVDKYWVCRWENSGKKKKKVTRLLNEDVAIAEMFRFNLNAIEQADHGPLFFYSKDDAKRFLLENPE